MTPSDDRPLNSAGYGLAPTHYTAYRRPRSAAVQGGEARSATWTDASSDVWADASSDIWAGAPRTPRFVDMVTGQPALLDTSASIVWDDDALYIALWATDPDVRASMTERDSLLFFENDLEVFIDGGDTYYELEVNALGTVYEVFYIWRDAYTRGGRWDTPRFDVHSPRTHSFGGDHTPSPSTFWTGNHPRGTRWAFLDYDLPGLQVAVSVDGVDQGWSARVRMPWAGLSDLAGGRSLPPTDGDTWGIFLGRFQQVTTRSPGPAATMGWSVGAHGVADTHIPESFTQVTFSQDEVTVPADAAPSG